MGPGSLAARLSVCLCRDSFASDSTCVALCICTSVLQDLAVSASILHFLKFMVVNYHILGLKMNKK